MRWDTLVTAWIARLNADAALTALMGGTAKIYPAQSSKPVEVPSIEWQVIYDREGESFNPMGVRLDLFIKGTLKAAQVEKRIRQISHRDTAQMLGGLRSWIRWQDSSTLEFPSDPGVTHRALDFELETVRSKYVA